MKKYLIVCLICSYVGFFCGIWFERSASWHDREEWMQVAQEACEYVQLTNTGLYKSLVERVQKLEQELTALRTQVSTKSWFQDVQINRPPYQQPMPYMAYNPATGQPEQKD